MTALVVAALAVAAPASVEVGQPAPGFSLPDLDGRTVTLSGHRGKVVVLEWFNPGCPYVKAAHSVGSLVDLAARKQAEGVVWLAVNSAAPGKQGHGVEVNRAAAAAWKMGHPVLLDEDGTVGKAYGATNTPHLFVIDAQGRLAYQGAIDNSPDGERASPAGGTLVEYVSAALADLAAGRPVQTPRTRAYGCSVKYR
jgi:peroxiredoxin